MTTMATPAMASAANTFKPFPSHVSSYDEEGMRERAESREREREQRKRAERAVRESRGRLKKKILR